MAFTLVSLKNILLPPFTQGQGDGTLGLWRYLGPWVSQTKSRKPEKGQQKEGKTKDRQRLQTEILCDKLLQELATPKGPLPQGPPMQGPPRPAAQGQKFSSFGFTFCPQDEIEPILVNAARALPYTDVRFAHACDSVAQDADGVTVTVLDLQNSTTSSIRASYVIAADGSRGHTRENLGIALEGKGALAHFINILFEADLTDVTKGQQVRLCLLKNGTVSGLLIAINNTNLWVFHLLYYPEKGESPANFTNEKYVELTRAALEVDVEIKIVSVMPWEAGVRVADKYQVGRVFLAGDSAHIMPPFGGFGATTGIADAHNLAWKLAMVLKGAANEKLLLTYNQERRPVAQQLCGVSAGRTAKLLEYFGLEEKRENENERNVAANKGEGETRKPMGPPPFDPRFGDLALVLLAIQYDSSAIIASKEKEVPMIASENDECTVIPGVKLPHFDVIKNGATLSSLELVKSAFTLILSSQMKESAAEWISVANTITPKIDVLQMGIDFHPVNEAEAMHRFNCAGALVRPDGHVAWKIESDENPSKLGDVLSVLLH